MRNLTMKIDLKKSQISDLPFLEKMLYEAVFWKDPINRPSIEEGLSLPYVKNAIAEWGKRKGDIAVVAVVNSKPVGAAWLRYWTDSNNTRGYINKNIPVLAIAVEYDFRHQGVGRKLMDWLLEYAAKKGIKKVSLCVSKDNYSLSLYLQKGFKEFADIGDSYLMIRE